MLIYDSYMSQTYAICIYYESEFYGDFFQRKFSEPAHAKFQIPIFSQMRGRDIFSTTYSDSEK